MYYNPFINEYRSTLMSVEREEYFKKKYRELTIAMYISSVASMFIGGLGGAYLQNRSDISKLQPKHSTLQNVPEAQKPKTFVEFAKELIP